MKHSLSFPIVATALTLAGCGSGNQPITDAEWNTGWTYWSDQQPEKVVVELPHDAMIAGKRNPEAKNAQATAFFDADVYHYQKTLHVSAEMLKRHITLQFEGIYRNPKVYINDQLAGGTAYGYIPFEVCADGLLKEGDNVIRIDADNSKFPNTRWYSGGGIYRPIHLLVQDPEAYIREVKVLTKSIDPATIALTIDHQGGTARTAILLNGEKVAQAEGNQAEISISNAKLWNAESPTLYEARVELLNNGKVVETRTEPFGIRTIAWNGQQGLLINGKPELLRGGCIHHDNGILGAREYDDVALRKVAIMKSYGFNAIRSAHNPISPALLRACDELGMYIMDEMWDMWYSYKNPEDYSKDFPANWQDDIDKIAARDYNHPSVIMYSIGNEVVEPSTPEGLEMEQKLVARFHEVDNSRPVTCGMNLMIQMMNAVMGTNITRNEENGSQSTETQKLTSEEYNKMVAESRSVRLASICSTSPVITTAYYVLPSMPRFTPIAYKWARKPIASTSLPVGRSSNRFHNSWATSCGRVGTTSVKWASVTGIMVRTTWASASLIPGWSAAQEPSTSSAILQVKPFGQRPCGKRPTNRSSESAPSWTNHSSRPCGVAPTVSHAGVGLVRKTRPDRSRSSPQHQPAAFMSMMSLSENRRSTTAKPSLMLPISQAPSRPSPSALMAQSMLPN